MYRQKPCQQAQHVKLYADLLQALKEKTFDSPGPPVAGGRGGGGGGLMFNFSVFRPLFAGENISFYTTKMYFRSISLEPR